MNYAKIRKFDVSNGPGIRSTLFVSGCTNKCTGCFNKELQDFNYGEKWTNKIEQKLDIQTKNEWFYNRIKIYQADCDMLQGHFNSALNSVRLFSWSILNSSLQIWAFSSLFV